MIPMDVMAMKMKSTGRNSKTSDPSVLQLGHGGSTGYQNNFDPKISQNTSEFQLTCNSSFKSFSYHQPNSLQSDLFDVLNLTSASDAVKLAHLRCLKLNKTHTVTQHDPTTLRCFFAASAVLLPIADLLRMISMPL